MADNERRRGRIAHLLALPAISVDREGFAQF
jgi:hypothetical protein